MNNIKMREDHDNLKQGKYLKETSRNFRYGKV